MTVDELMNELSAPTVSPKVVARVFNRSEPTIHKAIRKGDIPSIQIADTENIPTAWLRRQLQIDQGRQLQIDCVIANDNEASAGA